MQVHKQLAVVSSWQAIAVAHVQPITAVAASGASGGSGHGGALVASCDSSGRLLVWNGPQLQHQAAVTSAAAGSSTALVWLPLENAGAAAAARGGQQQAQQQAQQQQQQHWLAVGRGAMLQCYTVSGRQTVTAATTALPAGCSSIVSLHVLTGASSSGASGTGSSCLLLAVCSSSASRGSMLSAWQCTISSGSASSLQLQLAGTAAVSAAGAVTAAATVGGEQLLVGAADGAVLLLSLGATGSGVQLETAASLQEEGPVAAVAADEGCLHIATAGSSGLSVWTAAAPDSSGSSCTGPASSRSYSRAASVQLPAGSGNATAAAWLCHSVVPCLAVATSCGCILLLAPLRSGRSGSSWQWVAELPATSAGSPGIQHLTAGGGCSSLTAAAGNQLLRLSESVLLPLSRRQGGGDTSQLLGRWARFP